MARLVPKFLLLFLQLLVVGAITMRDTCSMKTVAVFGGTGLLGRECVYQVGCSIWDRNHLNTYTIYAHNMHITHRH